MLLYSVLKAQALQICLCKFIPGCLGGFQQGQSSLGKVDDSSYGLLMCVSLGRVCLWWVGWVVSLLAGRPCGGFRMGGLGAGCLFAGYNSFLWAAVFVHP